MKKGFTLIELLVVIAIIGILSSIVLVSLSDARGKGKDGAIKSNLANARAQAELYYTTTYSGVCTNTTTGINNAIVASGVTMVNPNENCRDGSSGWAATAQLSTGKWFCVDSNGFSRETATDLIGGATDFDCSN